MSGKTDFPVMSLTQTACRKLKLPFMQRAAKVRIEPFLTNAAERLDGRFGGPAA